MTKSKSSTSSVVAPSKFVIYFVNSTQYLHHTCVVGAAVTVISPIT